MRIIVITSDIAHHSGTAKLKTDMIVECIEDDNDTLTYGDACLSIARPDGSKMDVEQLAEDNTDIITTSETKPADFMAQKYLWQGSVFVLDPAWVAPAWAA